MIEHAGFDLITRKCGTVIQKPFRSQSAIYCSICISYRHLLLIPCNEGEISLFNSSRIWSKYVPDDSAESFKSSFHAISLGGTLTDGGWLPRFLK